MGQFIEGVIYSGPQTATHIMRRKKPDGTIVSTEVSFNIADQWKNFSDHYVHKKIKKHTGMRSKKMEEIEPSDETKQWRISAINQLNEIIFSPEGMRGFLSARHISDLTDPEHKNRFDHAMMFLCDVCMENSAQTARPTDRALNRFVIERLIEQWIRLETEYGQYPPLTSPEFNKLNADQRAKRKEIRTTIINTPEGRALKEIIHALNYSAIEGSANLFLNKWGQSPNNSVDPVQLAHEWFIRSLWTFKQTGQTTFTYFLVNNIKTQLAHQLAEETRRPKGARFHTDESKDTFGAISYMADGREKNPGHKLIQQETLEHIRNAIETLKPADHDIVTMRLKGETWVAIARTVSSSPEAVRQKFNKIIRDITNPHEEGEEEAVEPAKPKPICDFPVSRVVQARPITTTEPKETELSKKLKQCFKMTNLAPPEFMRQVSLNPVLSFDEDEKALLRNSPEDLLSSICNGGRIPSEGLLFAMCRIFIRNSIISEGESLLISRLQKNCKNEVNAPSVNGYASPPGRR